MRIIGERRFVFPGQYHLNFSCSCGGCVLFVAAGELKESITLPKKTAEYQRAPNRRLKHERELRGWSQQYVATRINAERYYVSRWEIGTTSPSPDYRRKLCEVFGMNAEELGLLAGDKAGTNGHKAVQVPREGITSAPLALTPFLYDPAIPPQLAAHGLVGRDELLDRVKQQLLVGESLALSALNGLPGVGKTALAITIAHDSAVQQYFCDGILWAGLGYRPDVISHLSRWGALLGIELGEMAQLSSAGSWADAIRAKIGLHRMLLVVDDAWKLEEALTFKVGGPGCAYLVTTRMPDIASGFACNGATVIRELGEDDSMTLLARLAPEVVEYKPDQVRSLVRSVGGLPLALTLMGNYLRIQAYPGNGPSRRLQAALDRLHHAEKRLWLALPQAPTECSPNLRPDMPLSLHVIIGMSYQYLDEQAQYALRALSLFPAKPNTFSEEAALAVSAVSTETLDSLTSAGLLEGSGNDRYTLHQVIADYAQLQPVDAAAQERMARFFISYMEAHTTDYDALELESSNMLMALIIARELGAAQLVATALYGLARAAAARGDHAEARRLGEESLALFKHMGHEKGNQVEQWLASD